MDLNEQLLFEKVNKWENTVDRYLANDIDKTKPIQNQFQKHKNIAKTKTINKGITR